MKLTTINNRIDRAGVHNDRNYDYTKSAHINAEKVQDNMFWTYNGDREHSFKEIEMGFYAKHFSEHLKEQNLKYDSYGLPQKKKTLEQYYKGKNTKPEDRIIQIGNKWEHVTPEQLWDVTMQYVKDFDEKHGDYCKILTVALHVDEITPHVHIRRVWIGHDKDGLEYICQGNALQKYREEHNITLNGRYTNAKTIFTAEDRQMIAEICRDKNIELELENPEKRMHYPTREYKEIAEEIERLRFTKDTEEQHLSQTVEKMNSLSDEIYSFLMENLKLWADRLADIEHANNKKKEKERLMKLFKIVSEEMGKLMSIEKEKDITKKAIEKEVNSRTKDYEHFIKKKKLLKEYEMFLENEKKKKHEKNISIR